MLGTAVSTKAFLLAPAIQAWGECGPGPARMKFSGFRRLIVQYLSHVIGLRTTGRGEQGEY